MKTALILLAAGSSSRLRQPKQALPYRGTTLLQHSLQAALASPVELVILVAGAETGLVIEPEVRLQVVHNHASKEGMASSIRLGLATLEQAFPDADSVILMVCDQPYVSGNLLKALLAAAQKDSSSIVACSYRDTLGTPVFFRKTHFAALAALQGNEGAKKIVLQHRDSVSVISFEQGSIDIDTREDYEALLRRED